MVSSMDVTPGVGVDFTAVGQVLLIVLVLYVLSSALAWLAAYLLNIVVVGTIRRLRADVEQKVRRIIRAKCRWLSTDQLKETVGKRRRLRVVSYQEGCRGVG